MGGLFQQTFICHAACKLGGKTEMHQDKLNALYGEFRSGADVRGALALRLSSPLLLSIGENWAESKNRLLLVGQETLGWDFLPLAVSCGRIPGRFLALRRRGECPCPWIPSVRLRHASTCQLPESLLAGIQALPRACQSNRKRRCIMVQSVQVFV